jgi:protein involved in polysaccharide export with SLBB domain
MRYRFLVAVLSAAVSIFGATNAQSEDYKLGPQDRVRLRVDERHSATSEVLEWQALTGEYSIGAAGEISLPLIGKLKAAGLTTDQLAEAIGGQIRDRTGLSIAPVVATELVQYRPFYIVGTVERAGEYPFRPGLTVLQAVAIAGGIRRSLATGRELIVQKGEVVQLSQLLDSLRVRKARLNAELDNSENIVLPPDLDKRKNQDSIKSIFEQETAILRARQKALSSEVEALTGLKDFLAKEVLSIEEQIKQQDKERRMVRDESANINTLAEKGLVVSPTRLALERTVSQLEGDRLRLETLLLRAKQENSRTEISILEARNKWATDVATLLRETEDRLRETQLKLNTGRTLLAEAGEIVTSAEGPKRQSAVYPRYTLVRQIDSKTSTFEVSEAGSVQPGDSIKVELPLLGEFSEEVSSN